MSPNAALTTSRLFASFAKAESLAAWWGPDGFTNQFEHFDFVEEGSWVFTMRGPDGRCYPNRCVFVRLEQDRCVGIRHEGLPFFTLTITLEAVPEGTMLWWEQVFDSAESARAVAALAGPANEQNLDRLTALLESANL